MNIHEYQAKAVLREFDVPVPRGIAAFSIEEAEKAAHQLGGPVWVVKAQIHAGGRGKAGGVKLVRSPEDAAEAAGAMLGKPLVTHQTGSQGRDVKRVYVEAGCDIARELYLGASTDRGTGRITLIAAAEGGMEIEELAERSPEKILRIPIDPASGIEPFHARKIAFGLGVAPAQVRPMIAFVTALYRAFTELDASLVEINPLAVTGATRPRRTRSSSKRASTASTTSSSTARSAAWSTAPASRWRRWTSSSSMAWSRRTSSMSAVARRKRR